MVILMLYLKEILQYHLNYVTATVRKKNLAVKKFGESGKVLITQLDQNMILIHNSQLIVGLQHMCIPFPTSSSPKHGGI